MVSVAVSKLGKTDLVFVQPGAKITGFITVRTYSNNIFCQQFAVSRTTTAYSSRTERHAHRSHHTVAYLRSNVPEFIEPENWPPSSPDLNPANYSVWTAL